MALHVHVLGDGRPLVVLPSFSLDHVAMAAVFEPVLSSRSGWMRIYVDLPGTGTSSPGEPRSDAVLDEVVHTLDGLLERQSFLVAGWSYGAYLAAGLARRLPERVDGILLTCSGFKIRPEDRNLTGVLPSRAEPDWLTDVPPRLHEHFEHAIGRQSAQVARRVAEVIALNGPTDATYLATLRNDGFALTDEGARVPYEGNVTFLNGRRDRVAGYLDAFEALDRYDRATYVAVADAGHYLPLEQPQIFAAVALSWLDECASESVS